jgi:methionyl-tRNA formyltransferase
MALRAARSSDASKAEALDPVGLRFALIGRTETLLESGRRLAAAGHRPSLVVTSKPAPEYRASVEDFAALASEWAVPFVRTVSAERIVAELERIGQVVDIGISMNFAGILPESLTSRFGIGVLNVHGGDLPRYRGNACQAWAIINGEDHVGLCVHKMVGGELDSGDIMAERRMALGIDTRVGQIWEWIDKTTPELLLEACDRLSGDPDFILRSQDKDPALALRCYPRTPEDGRIDWSRNAIDVLRLINASSEPYAGAFCAFEGREVRIWRGRLRHSETPYLAVPGQVTDLEGHSVAVATGNGQLWLDRLTVDGVAIAPRDLISSVRARFG